MTEFLILKLTDNKSLFWWCGQVPVETGLKKRCLDVKGMGRGWMDQAEALKPYHLLAYHGNLYVFARNMAKNRVATFAISRFRRIEPTGCSFPLPLDFDPSTQGTRAVGLVLDTGREW